MVCAENYNYSVLLEFKLWLRKQRQMKLERQINFRMERVLQIMMRYLDA
jgi:hypothetical protein